MIDFLNHKNRHCLVVVLRLLLRLAAISWMVAAVSGEPQDDDPCANNPGSFEVGGRRKGRRDSCENLAKKRLNKRKRLCNNSSLLYAEECPGVCHVVDENRNCACIDIPYELYNGFSCSEVVTKFCSLNAYYEGCPGTCNQACWTAEPSETPSAVPSTDEPVSPTDEPSETPSAVSPTDEPSETPSKTPYAGPTTGAVSPTDGPSTTPTLTPSKTPSAAPSTAGPTQRSNSNNILVNGGFEDGTIDPWKAREGGTIELSTEYAFSGDHGVTSESQGIEQEIFDVVEPGVTYNLSAWARLVAPDDGNIGGEISGFLAFMVQETFNVSIPGTSSQRTSTSTQLLGFAKLDATDGWTQLTGSYPSTDTDPDYGQPFSRKLFASGSASFAIDEVFLVEDESS